MKDIRSWALKILASVSLATWVVYGNSVLRYDKSLESPIGMFKESKKGRKKLWRACLKVLQACIEGCPAEIIFMEEVHKCTDTSLDGVQKKLSSV